MKRYVLLIFIFLFVACDLTKEIEYEANFNTHWIVINGFINENDGANVIVKKTVLPNTPDSNDYLDSPAVSLICNDQIIATLTEYEKYKYKADDSLKFDSDAIYKIKVVADGLGTAVSEGQQLCSKTVIDTVYLIRDTVNWANYLYIEFDDQVTENNYYTYNVVYYNNGESYSSILQYFLPLWVFSDEGFTGRIKKYQKLSSLEFDSAKVVLYTVPEFYYQFIQSYSDYEISNQIYYYETTYPVETNINNGFGFFIGYGKDEFTYINEYKKYYYE